MSSTTAPATAPIAEVQAMPERLGVRTALLIIAGASVLLWVGIGMVAQNLFG
jgi:hypothetical protein